MLDNVYFSVPLPPSQDSRQQQQPPLQKQQQQQNHALPFQNQLLSTSFFGNHASCLDSISSSVLHHHQQQQQNLLFLAPPLTTSTTHNPSGAHHQQQITAAAAVAAAASSHLDNQNGTNKISTPTTNQLDQQNNSNNGSSRRLKPPRAPALKKDRHTKIYTAKGLRDRRVRLSMNIARNFFDLQDILGFDKASKTLEWLFSKSKRAIDEIAMEYNKSYNDGDKGRLTAQLGARNSTSSFMLPSGRDHRRIDQEVAMPDKEKTRSGRSSSYNRVVVDSVVARERRAKARERARERTKEMKINKELLLQQHNDNDHGHHHHHHHEHEHDDHHAMNHYLINNNNTNNNSRSSLINGISDIDQFEDQGSCSSGTHQLQQQQLLWHSNPGLNESIVIKTKPKLAVNYSTTSSSTTDRIDHHHHRSFVPISPLGTKGAIASSSLSALSHIINLSNRGQKPLEICGYQILR